MKSTWKDKLRNYALIQRGLAYLFTLTVVVVFLPKEERFKFEYQLDQPWKHEKLIAPFDFGILKDPVQLAAELDEIALLQPPVLSLDPEVDQLVLTRMDDAWEHATDSLMMCEVERKQAMSVVSALLRQGIVKPSPFTKDLRQTDPIMLERAGTLERLEFGQAMQLQTALDSLSVVASKFNRGDCADLFMEIVSAHMMSNANYNDSLTEKLIAGLQEEVVPIQGKVNQGEAIIDRGEVVDQNHFRALESLKHSYAERTLSESSLQWSLFGEVMIIALLLGLMTFFIFLNQDRVYNDPRPITLALALVAVSFAASSIAYSSQSVSLYVIPIGIAPLLLRMFFDFRVSLFSFIMLVVLIATFVSNPLEYILVQLSAISLATIYQSSSTKRSRMLGTALLVFLGYSVIYLAIRLSQTGGFEAVESEYFGWFAINALLCTMVFPLIYVVEKVLGYISETTLLELSDSNQPLLRELATKAPGTFQHSLQVANLAEKVARKIGGSAVLLRTAAMYHDIGKMKEPQFFVENQVPENNPHDDLEPEESASIILGHVLSGVEMARSQGLPIDIIQFILTHHGTSTVQYFLKRAREQAVEVDLSQFSYPGPKPGTKEQAILMMADSVEAASRSLKKFDDASLDKLVDKIVDYQRGEGQFEVAPITFRDIAEAKQVLKAALKGIYHHRVSYD